MKNRMPFPQRLDQRRANRVARGVSRRDEDAHLHRLIDVSASQGALNPLDQLNRRDADFGAILRRPVSVARRQEIRPGPVERLRPDLHCAPLSCVCTGCQQIEVQRSTLALDAYAALPTRRTATRP